MVDPWEALQDEYQRTALVLDHFDHAINEVLGGVLDADGALTCAMRYNPIVTSHPGLKHRVRVLLLAGSDLIHTMSEPGVWSAADVCPGLFRYDFI